MAVVQKYARSFKNPASQFPLTGAAVAAAEGDHKMISTGPIAVTNGDSINSKAYLGQVPSSAILDVANSVLHHGSITGLSDVDIGIEQAGVVKDADILADGITLASAGTKLVCASVPLADIGKPLWELLGLSSDPGVMYDIVATFKAAAGADGTFSAQICYAR